MKTFNHVCPRNCPSSCTMISHVENGHLVHITGNPQHPYTKGKLCAKGFSYLEKNSHHDRLKYPYYQEVKGSGKFKQITWEKAFDLIKCEIVSIYERFGNFLPLALYKGSGNVGVHHFVTDQFFTGMGKTTRIIGSSPDSDSILYGSGAVSMSDPSTLKDASMIMIWGANPSATNIHLIPYIIEAKVKGAKIVVIDPLYTQTAELANLYIQLSPGTDGALANVLIKGLVESNAVDQVFLEENSFGAEEFLEQIKMMDHHTLLKQCGIVQEALDVLVKWLKDAGSVSHIIGSGIQKHINGEQNIRAISALAAIHGDIGKIGGDIFFKQNNPMIFNNQKGGHLEDRVTNWNHHDPCIEMLWISCGNPLTQEPNPQVIHKFLKDIPFVVTVDHFLTPTAAMSNLVLPTTTHFEELDIVINSWYKEIGLNERAIPPYFESRSEWNIMKELAIRLGDLCTFPIHSSEEEYLNAQFNDTVFDHYFVRSIDDLREKSAAGNPPIIAWEDKRFAAKTEKYQFLSTEAEDSGFPSLPLFVEGKVPTSDYPFWLITPHHPYAFNSQFHFLNLAEEGEAFVGIHPIVAKRLGIFNGEVVKVFNDQDCIEIKAVYSNQVPKDVLLIYQGWYPESEVIVNQLVLTDGSVFYDTFVSVGKL